jgi:DNA-binding MarR family transcriptional regulator
MDKDNLLKVADSLIDFLWIIRNNVLTQNDMSKNFHPALEGEKKCFSDSSMPPSHVRVIFYLLEFNSSPISQIAENLKISKPNMTPIIDNLINYGLVNRFTDPNDRRILRVELTDKALKILHNLRDSIRDSFAEKISPLSDDEIVMLDESIENLVFLLKKLK